MERAIRHPTMKPVSRKLLALELQVRKRAASRTRRTPASRVQDEQVELQMTTAAAAPTARMVSALEARSLAHPSHPPMYPHHTPSRVTAQVLGEALSLQCSSCSRRSGALEQRDGPYGRAAWRSEVEESWAARRAHDVLACESRYIGPSCALVHDTGD